MKMEIKEGALVRINNLPRRSDTIYKVLYMQDDWVIIAPYLNGLVARRGVTSELIVNLELLEPNIAVAAEEFKAAVHRLACCLEDIKEYL